jgi:hypothetical protein
MELLVLKLPRTQISGGDVPLVGGRAAVDRVVLVNYIDGFTLDGEFDMDSASTVICLQRRVVFTVLVILFLHTTFPGPILPTVSTHILEPRTVAAFFVLC